MRGVLKWTGIGCGCLSTGFVVLFGVLVALEVGGVGLSRLSSTSAAKPAAPALVAVATPLVATNATQVPKPQATVPQTTAPVAAPTPLAKPGQTVTMTTPAGLRLQVTVMGVEDEVPIGRYNQPAKGRYFAIDWSLKNDGAVDVDINRLDLKVQTAEGHVLQRGTPVREPDLDTSKLGPGQTMRGWLTYDVPTGARVMSAIYQPTGARQFVIADLSP